MDKQAFLEGYMYKQAGAWDSIAKLFGKGTDVGTDAAKWAWEKAMLAAILAPVAVGAGAGALASHITSPDELDQEAVQKKLQAMELQEYKSELQRRKELEKKQKGINETVKGERSLRI